MNKDNYLIIDFDSTFVQGETLEELASLTLSDSKGKDLLFSQMKDITREGMEGVIPFEESLTRRLKLFKAHKRHIDLYVDLLRKRITPSVLRNLHFFRKYAPQLYFVSGGFIDYIWPVVSEFGIKRSHVIANRFRYSLTGTIIGYDKSIPLCRQGGKTQVVRDLMLHGTITVVGDGFTDYEIKKAGVAHNFIAFTENIKRENIVSLADSIAPDFDHVFANL